MADSLDLGVLQVDVRANTDKATRDLLGFKDVVNSVEGIAGDLKKEFVSLANTINKIDFDGLSKKFDTFGNTMTTKVTLPLTAVGVAGFKMAADLEQAVGKTDAVFKESANVVRDWSQDAIDSMGMAQVTALQMSSGFGALGTALKVTDSQALEMSMTLTALASDLSAFYDTSLSEAKTGLESIFTGEMEAMKKYGTVMSVANLEAHALANGINKTYKEMSEAEKVMLRYSFVLESTKVAQGTFAREADTASVQLQVFKETLKEVGAIAGEELLPIFTEVLGGFKDVLLGFRELDDSTQELIVKGGLLLALIGPISKGLAGLSKGVATAKALGVAFEGVALKIGMSTGALGLFATALGVSTVAIGNLIAKEKEGQEVLKETAALQKKIKDGSVTTSDLDMANSDKLLEVNANYESIANTIDDLQAKRHELAQSMADEAIANGSNTESWKNMYQELKNIEDQLASNEVQLKEYNTFLVSNYHTVDAGVNVAKTHAKALDELANKEKEAKEAEDALNKARVEGLELTGESSKFIQGLAEEYMELITNQELSAEQLERVAGLEEFLVGVYGDEVIVRDELNRGIGLNISMLDKEILANNNLTEAQRKATNMMAQYGETRVKNQQKTTLNTIKMIEKEIEAYKELQRATLGTTEWAMAQYALSFKENQLAKLKEEVAGYDFVLDKVGDTGSYSKDYNDFKKNEDKKEQTFEEKQKARIEAYEYEMETRKYYNDLTLEEELEGYRELIKIAEGNTGEQERLYRELFRVKQDLLRQETEEVQAECQKQIDARREVYDQEVRDIEFGLSEELKELQGELDRLDYEQEQARIDLQRKEKQMAIDDAKARLSMAVTEEERFKAMKDLDKAQASMDKFNTDLRIKEEKRRIQEEMRLAREKAEQAKAEKQKEYDDDVKAYETSRDLKLEAMEKQYEREFELESGKRTDFNVVETNITADLQNQYDIRNRLFAESINKDVAQTNKIKAAIQGAFMLPSLSGAIQGALAFKTPAPVPTVSQVQDAYRGEVINDNSNFTVNQYITPNPTDNIDELARKVTTGISSKIKDYRANKGGGRR